MSETSIQWTDYTFNPWWGCVRVSPGCEHCYAETFSHRLGLKLWGPSAGRRFFDDKHWTGPINWNRRRENGDPRHLVFCASMADVFERHDALDAERNRLFALIERTPALTWQLLTKRPENVLDMVPASWRSGFPPNVWMLVTAEDQARADLRIPLLLEIHARVRGVSYEPALGPIDFDGDPYDGPGWLRGYHAEPVHACGGDPEACAHRCPEPEQTANERIDWVIVGGESGHGARAFDVAWARDAVEQCKAAGVACFVKQLGARPTADEATNYGDWLTLNVKDRKGGAMSEWPEDIRVREFPL